MLLEEAYFPTFTNPLSFHRLLAREQVVIDRILRHAWVRVFLMNSIAPHARLSFSAALLPWNSIKVQVTTYVTSASLRHLISHNFMAFQWGLWSRSSKIGVRLTERLFQFYAIKNRSWLSHSATLNFCYI